MKEIALPATNFAENAVIPASRVSAVSWCFARKIYQKGEHRKMRMNENEMNVSVSLEIVKATIGTTNQVQSVVMPASSALHFWLLSYTRQETAKEVMM